MRDEGVILVAGHSLLNAPLIRSRHMAL